MPTGHGPSEGLGASCRGLQGEPPSWSLPAVHPCPQTTIRRKAWQERRVRFNPYPTRSVGQTTERFCPDFAEGEMGRIGLTTRLKNPAESKSHRAKRVASPEGVG